MYSQCNEYKQDRIQQGTIMAYIYQVKQAKQRGIILLAWLL